MIKRRQMTLIGAISANSHFIKAETMSDCDDCDNCARGTCHIMCVACACNTCTPIRNPQSAIQNHPTKISSLT